VDPSDASGCGPSTHHTRRTSPTRPRTVAIPPPTRWPRRTRGPNALQHHPGLSMNPQDGPGSATPPWRRGDLLGPWCRPTTGAPSGTSCLLTVAGQREPGSANSPARVLNHRIARRTPPPLPLPTTGATGARTPASVAVVASTFRPALPDAPAAAGQDAAAQGDRAPWRRPARDPSPRVHYPQPLTQRRGLPRVAQRRRSRKAAGRSQSSPSRNASTMAPDRVSAFSNL